jgi:putative serine/threonine protein kinase
MLALEKLNTEPYATIVCYPRVTKTELKNRLEELRKDSITALEFAGEKKVFDVSILGKGCVGIVTLAYRNDERIALKIRRVDADRARMQQEAKLLKKANAENVGPKLLGVSRNFLLMQFIDGTLFPDWLGTRRSKSRIKSVLRDVLEQCWRLDEIRLDHGELSHAPKHIIVDEHGKPFIVDFETASLNRRPSNVTAICQFLFMGSETAKKVAAKLGEKDKEAVVEALRHYKSNRTRGNFGGILRVLGL